MAARISIEYLLITKRYMIYDLCDLNIRFMKITELGAGSVALRSPVDLQKRDGVVTEQ